MTIDGKKIEDLSLDQIGASLQLIADHILTRFTTLAVGRIASNLDECGAEFRKLWCRHD